LKVLKLHLQTTIWTLLKAGSIQRQIKRATVISRHTIRSHKKKFDSQNLEASVDQASAPIQTASTEISGLGPIVVGRHASH